MREGAMDKDVTVRYNREGDYLEVLFELIAEFFRETNNDTVMENVDQDGNLIGFSILNVSQTQSETPIFVTLRDAAV